jgi:hypothetical protein
MVLLSLFNFPLNKKRIRRIFSIVISRDGLSKSAREICIKHDVDVSLISLFYGFRGPLGYGTTAGGLDILDHQDFLTRVGKDKIVADLRVESNRSEIMPGFLKVDLRLVLGDVSVAA